MIDIEIVSKETHGSKKWKRSNNYLFTSKDSHCPIFINEAPKAMLHAPIAFILEKNNFFPVIVQSLISERNLMVSLKGDWLTKYIPALYRAYPFLMASTEDGKEVLCIRKVALTRELENSESFFNESGSLADSTQEIFSFLSSISQSKKITLNICALLKELDLIIPWKIRLTLEDATREIEGLYRIDEEKLNSLSAENLIELRNSGALSLVYSQLLSMQNLNILKNLLENYEQPIEKQGLILGSENESGTLNFDNF